MMKDIFFNMMKSIWRLKIQNLSAWLSQFLCIMLLKSKKLYLCTAN